MNMSARAVVVGRPREAHDNRLTTLIGKKGGSEHQSGPKERKLRTRKLEASCAQSAGFARTSLSDGVLGFGHNDRRVSIGSRLSEGTTERQLPAGEIVDSDYRHDVMAVQPLMRNKLAGMPESVLSRSF